MALSTDTPLFAPEAQPSAEEHALEQDRAYYAALKREREGYVANDNKDGVTAVDKELRRVGATLRKAGFDLSETKE